MTPATPAVSALRQRMLDDMRMRKLEPKTQSTYIRAVRHLAGFLQRSPDTATAEDLRRFQLHMVDQGASPTAGLWPWTILNAIPDIEDPRKRTEADWLQAKANHAEFNALSDDEKKQRRAKNGAAVSKMLADALSGRLRARTRLRSAMRRRRATWRRSNLLCGRHPVGRDGSGPSSSAALCWRYPVHLATQRRREAFAMLLESKIDRL